MWSSDTAGLAIALEAVADALLGMTETVRRSRHPEAGPLWTFAAVPASTIPSVTRAKAATLAAELEFAAQSVRKGRARMSWVDDLLWRAGIVGHGVIDPAVIDAAARLNERSGIDVDGTAPAGPASGWWKQGRRLYPDNPSS
jgi:hypothetical protein